jgi:hypothetical protein
MTRAKPVTCFETGETFPSAEAAGRALPDPKPAVYVSSAISRRCAVQGLHFYKVEDFPSASPPASYFARRSARRVTCFETGEEFESTRDAAMKYATSEPKLRRAIRTGKPIAGRRFFFSEDVEPAAYERKRQGRRVRCVQPPVEYPNEAEAAKALGVSRQAVCAALKNGRPCRGHRFEYVHDDIEKRE